MAKRVGYDDFLYTGPGTLAGRYLRRFWQPVYCSHELAPGRAVPIRIMSEDFTLYRGEDGTPHLVGFRCAHRGTQLSVGWVEGDAIRCFYHGWKYAASGQCIEQPAEPQPFCEKIRIPSYPVREHIGLIFAYLGEGEPPLFNRYTSFEDPGCVVDAAAHHQPCNYFNNVDNSMDGTHVAWVHKRHRDHAQDYIVQGRPTLSHEENEWGIVHRAKYPDGAETVGYFGMPNINYVIGQIVDPEFVKTENIIFKVPIDDENHFQFHVFKLPVSGEAGRRILERRRAQRAAQGPEHAELARAILSGKLSLDEVDPSRIEFVQLEDAIAQAGQGAIYRRENEHLGRGDGGVILLRKVWERELQALADGRPLKRWAYHPGMVPTSPGLSRAGSRR